MRAVTLKDGGTVVSDGWDDAAKNHLINFLVGTAKGFFFDGTIMLKSDDSENAERVGPSSSAPRSRPSGSTRSFRSSQTPARS